MPDTHLYVVLRNLYYSYYIIFSIIITSLKSYFMLYILFPSCIVFSINQITPKSSPNSRPFQNEGGVTEPLNFGKSLTFDSEFCLLSVSVYKN